MDSLSSDQQDELASLESPSTVVEPTSGAPKPANAGNVAPAPGDQVVTSSPGKSPLSWLTRHLNVYLVAFLVLLVISGTGGTLFYLRSGSTSSDAPSQPLSQSTLDQLSTSDVNVGEPKHTLNVQSDTVFSGNVLVRDNLQIAGTLQVGSNLAIAGLRVTGNSTFDDVQVTKSLALTGNESIQGQLNVQQSLQVNGAGTFSGVVSASSITAGSLQLSGDLTLTHHLTAGGSTPGRTNGGALGSGGTASVSGSDTAGTITINTGSGTAAGCYITVNFAAKFNSTPHVVVSPVGSTSATFNYYVNRTTSNFSLCSSGVPADGTTYVFDYIALD